MVKVKKIKALANEKEKVHTTTDGGEKAEATPVIKKVSIAEQPPKTTALLDKEPTKEESQAFESFLGNVEKLSLTQSGRNLTVFIDGKKSTLIDDPTVKKCSLRFMWRKRENNVIDGDSKTNRGYSVVSKKIMRTAPFKLTVSRDDTPNEDHYTVGDEVLCCTIRANFEKRRKDNLLKSVMTPKKIKDQRNEFAKQQAVNKNVDEVTKAYANVNAGDNRLMPSKLQTPKDYDDLIEKAIDDAGKSDTTGF